MDKAQKEKLFEETHKIFGYSHGCHGWDHLERVYNICMHIGKKEKADLEILEVAAFLHDIGRPQEDSSNGKICHAEKGAELARQLLEKHGFEKETIERVVHCIESHRARGQKVPVSLEAKILFDADKLDSIGAVGVGRAFLFAGQIGSRLHNKNVEVEKTADYSEEDTAYREFLKKLSKIKENMLTAEGKKLAVERHDFMAKFFGRLNREIEGEI